MATGCAWAAGQVADRRAFEKRNAAALSLCGALTPGMPISDVQGRAQAVDGAITATVDGRLVVRIRSQAPCVVETMGGRVRSAAVARNG